MSFYTITMDGPAGSGKSTVAKEIAKRLGFTFLDTGALYRAAAVLIDEAHCDILNDKECADIITQSSITISSGRTYANGRDVTDIIRSRHISELASSIAVHPSVRQELLHIQRSFKGVTSLVAEGRDTGSVVFPDADIKFYLDATVEERARRRHAESALKETSAGMEQVISDIKKRDHRDRARAASPLIIPENAVVVDTTHLDLEGVVKKVLAIIRERLSD
jgi:cytidylate kinase